MKNRTKTRLGIAGLVYMMANAVLFGAGVVLVLTVPPLAANAAILLPVAVAASFVLAVPVALYMAPRLREAA